MPGGGPVEVPFSVAGALRGARAGGRSASACAAASAAGRSSSKALWTARSAAAAESRSTSTLILISLVVIIWMLMPAVGQGREHLARRRRFACACPRPTTETLATLGVVGHARGAERLGGRLGGVERLGQVVRGDGEADVGRPARSRRSARSCPRRCCAAAIVREDACGLMPGPVGHARDRDPGLVLDQGRAA